MTKKTFILCDDATGLPVPGKDLRLKDVLETLPDIDMIPLGAGAYRADVPNGAWRVFDVTGGGSGVDTGHVLESLAYLTREPAIGNGSAGQFLKAGKVWSLIEIEDVSGLTAALSDVASATALAEEIAARTAATNSLDARLDALEANLAVSLWTQSGFQTTGMRPMVGDNVNVWGECRTGMVLLNKFFAGIGYHLVGMVEMLANVSFAAGANVYVRLPNAVGLPAFASYKPFHGTWFSAGVSGNDSGPIFVVSASSTEIILELRTLPWSDIFLNRKINFSLDVVGS